MRALFFLVAFLAMLVFSAPVWASLPYYNPDIGYTIWLPKSWSEAPPSLLEGLESRKPWPVQEMAPDWKAGYLSPAGGQGGSLLVEVRPGRKMQAADISNFNRFLVQSLTRAVREQVRLPGVPLMRFKNATYFQDKKTLRIETEMVEDGRTLVSLTYIVYTRRGMLTFVGFVAPSDTQARQTIDKAVLSVYLDDKVRY